MNIHTLTDKIRDEVWAGIAPYLPPDSPTDEITETVTRGVVRRVKTYLQYKIGYEEVE